MAEGPPELGRLPSSELAVAPLSEDFNAVEQIGDRTHRGDPIRFVFKFEGDCELLHHLEAARGNPHVAEAPTRQGTFGAAGGLEDGVGSGLVENRLARNGIVQSFPVSVAHLAMRVELGVAHTGMGQGRRAALGVGLVVIET